MSALTAGAAVKQEIQLILAINDPHERREAARVFGGACPGWKLSFPEAIADVERQYSADEADAIVTDFDFHSGALAEWLTLWPLPAVVIVDGDEDAGRIERILRDEASLFLRRTQGGSYLSFLPLLVRKVLNIRESIVRQNAHIRMTEHQYLNLVQAIPDIVYTLDGDGRFLYLNDAVRDLGFEPAALIGRHFSEIIHPDDVPRVSRAIVLPALAGTRTGDAGAPKLFDERRSGRRMTRNLEVRLRRGGGNDEYRNSSVTCYGEVSCAGFRLPEYEGAGLGTMGIIRDVTQRKLHEHRLESELANKEILLKEIHHRVKNNLQVVSSLLNLQGTAVSDPAAHKVFLDCQTQIQSMSMVHEVLYTSSNFEILDMYPFFERLVDHLSSVYDGMLRGIEWSVRSEAVLLDLKYAIPVALIVNELVSNAFKHAFPSGRGGRIEIDARSMGDFILVTVEDDGVGFHAGGGSWRRGVGTDLVAALAAQLRGSVEYGTGGSGRGTRVVLRFPFAEQDAVDRNCAETDCAQAGS